jgi:hypothetical protein
MSNYKTQCVFKFLFDLTREDKFYDTICQVIISPYLFQAYFGNVSNLRGFEKQIYSAIYVILIVQVSCFKMQLSKIF